MNDMIIQPQTVNRKKNQQMSKSNRIGMRPAWQKQAREIETREFTHVEPQASRYSASEPLDESRLTVNWLAD